MSKKKGAGSLYRPTYPPPGQTYAEARAAGTLRQSPTWWCKYCVDGLSKRGTEKETEARRFLNARLGRVADHQPILPRMDRIEFDEARADLTALYKTTGKRNLCEVSPRLARLDKFFTRVRLASIGPAEVTRYAEARQAEGAANATINREISVLSKMLKVAYRNNKLARLPLFERLQESPPREGFFEREEFLNVRKRLHDDLQAAVTLYYTAGWRLAEGLPLARRQLDLTAGTLRLDPGQTKNDDGRIIYLTAELKGLLAAQVERVKALERRLGRIIPWLFPHLRHASVTKRRGQATLGEPMGQFRRRWNRACREAGVPGRLVHDLRRRAVRNMVNAGVPERVAQTVSGHKTRSVFDRYHIVSPGDLKDMARRMDAEAKG
jgi:integrase